MKTKITASWVEQNNQRIRVGRVLAAVAAKPEPRATRALPAHQPKSYNPKIVTAFFAENGIPEPEYEYQFHTERAWRFDLAWIFQPFGKYIKLALECDGGIWIKGGHNRGAQIKKTWEKENEANIMGWRILKCEPGDLCMMETVILIKRALEIQK